MGRISLSLFRLISMISTRYIFPMPDSVFCLPHFMVHLDFCFFHGLGLAEKSFVLLHSTFMY